MKKSVKEHLLTVIGVTFGAVAGYFYWKLAGFSPGSCAITSKPLNSTMYGAVMSGILFSTFQKNKKETV